MTPASDLDRMSSDDIELSNRPGQENSRNIENDQSQTTATGNNADEPSPNVFSVEGEVSNQDSTSSNNAISLDELKYGYSSFHAISTPVSITMILSALAVTYIQTDIEANTDSVSDFYTIFDVSGTDNSNVKNFGLSLINGLVIISVIAVATFVIVLLYKYRCMKLLVGYMIFSSAALLGVLGGVMFQTFIQRYHVVMDKITFYFLLVNFAAVGTMAIFYGKGIPSYITQMYLVLTSSILAWQLSFFNDWTAWMLLVLLALYDLCAVLTPCGPLKALVNLMQKDGAPEMPGLLYEARLPQGVERPGRGNRRESTSGNDANGTSSGHGAGNQVSAAVRAQSTTQPHPVEHGSTLALDPANQSSSMTRNSLGLALNTTISGQVEQDSTNDQISAVLPFAIAKIYKLPITGEECPQFVVEKYKPRAEPPVRSEYTEVELLTEVNVFFPRNGGRIVVEPPETSEDAPRWRRRDGSNLARYIVIDRQGEVKRVLVMNEDGKVFEEMQGEENDDDNGDSSGMSNTIKLGLGDFIFYSVLVAKAALHSFTTFAACMLVILAGLGGTLILLSVYHSALPALPISIFLGVIFFFTTKALIEPEIEIIMSGPFYV